MLYEIEVTDPHDWHDPEPIYTTKIVDAPAHRYYGTADAGAWRIPTPVVDHAIMLADDWHRSHPDRPYLSVTISAHEPVKFDHAGIKMGACSWTLVEFSHVHGHQYPEGRADRMAVTGTRNLHAGNY